MSKKSKIDVQTGHKLRRLDREQCERADQIYAQLEREREARDLAEKQARTPEEEIIMVNVAKWKAEKEARKPWRGVNIVFPG